MSRVQVSDIKEYLIFKHDSVVSVLVKNVAE